MPGMPKCSRSSSTSGVMRPRSSAMKGSIAEDLAEALEELVAGSLDPLAVDGGLLLGGDGPVGLEAAEVIEADDVVEGERAADAGDPPVEAALAQQAPLVERVAPALAGDGEVVGRDAGDADGVALLVELEELGVGPDVGAVVVDEDGDVAEDADVFGGAVLAQARHCSLKKNWMTCSMASSRP